MRYFRKSAARPGLAASLAQLPPEERSWLLCELLAEQWGDGSLPTADLLAAEYWLMQKMRAARDRNRNWRKRVWLIFMLLRYGALRLVEISSLAPGDLDLAGGVAHAVDGRQVPLPLAAARSMRPVWQEIILERGQPRPLACDASQLGRSLRECARAVDIPPGALSPRSLRLRRARELEALGLHPQLVSLFLGRREHCSRLFSEPQKLLRMRIQKEAIMKTSARNVFQGKITKLAMRGILADVELETPEGIRVAAVITRTSCESLGLAVGKMANALIKAPWVSISPAAKACRVENCYTGTVRAVNEDEHARETVVELPQGNLICAVDYTPAASQALNVGEKANVCFKPLAVILTVD